MSKPSEKISWNEKRTLAQISCRQQPCFAVKELLKGELSIMPPCVVCVYEGVLRKRMQNASI